MLLMFALPIRASIFASIDGNLYIVNDNEMQNKCVAIHYISTIFNQNMVIKWFSSFVFESLSAPSEQFEIERTNVIKTKTVPVPRNSDGAI